MLLIVVGHAGAAENWPDIPMPPKSATQWIAENMRVNGSPTRIMQFQSQASRQEVVAYYRSYWSGAYKLAPSVKPLDDATVVGQMHGPYLMTIQVQDADHGTSKGVLSVARVMGIKADREPGQLPMMSGARVISVVESDDPGIHSREVSVLAPQPPSSVKQFYAAALQNAGWRQIQGDDGGSAPRGAGSFLAFARDSSEMQVSIGALPKGRGSAVTANLVTKDTNLAER
jgi:hypothetical protein